MAKVDMNSRKPEVCLKTTGEASGSNWKEQQQLHAGRQPSKGRDNTDQMMNPAKSSPPTEKNVLNPPLLSSSSSRRRTIFPTLYDDSGSRVGPKSKCNDDKVSPSSHRRTLSLESLVKIGSTSQPFFSPIPQKAIVPNSGKMLANSRRVECRANGLPTIPRLHIPSFSSLQRSVSLTSEKDRVKEMIQEQRPIHRINDYICPYMRPRLGAFPTNKNKPLLSILKTKTNTLSSKEIGSEESIPSLASSADSDDEIRGMRHSLATSLNRLLDGCSPPRRGVGRCVVFDPRVWITIFERSTEEKSLTWYTSSEMERFKRAAIEKIYQNCNTELVPTGTGRLVRRPVHQCKALFTHPALTLDGEDNDDEMTIQRLAKGEMKSVLIVDPHDICLKLFGKAIRTMLPHLTISTARSSEEATKRLMEHKRFDMVIVEERLGLFHDKGDPNRSHPNESGSALIQLLSSQAGGSETLWIGVSAHFETDEERMKDSGADFQWPKPPPSFNKDMRDTLLKALLIKRGRDQAAFTYFGL